MKNIDFRKAYNAMWCLDGGRKKDDAIPLIR